MTTRRRRPGNRRRKPRVKKPVEVLVDEGDNTEAPLTVAVLQQKQNELLEQLPPETRRRLRFLSKHHDIPELAVVRLAISELYQSALEDEP